VRQTGGQVDVEHAQVSLGQLLASGQPGKDPPHRLPQAFCARHHAGGNAWLRFALDAQPIGVLGCYEL